KFAQRHRRRRGSLGRDAVQCLGNRRLGRRSIHRATTLARLSKAAKLPPIAISRSHCHPLTLSPSHLVTLSPCHLVTLSSPRLTPSTSATATASSPTAALPGRRGLGFPAPGSTPRP